MEKGSHNYLTIIITVVIVALLLFFLIDSLDNNRVNEINDSKNDNHKNGITALEGREIADNIAYEWNQNALLIYVTTGTVDDNGKAIKWRFEYSNLNRSKELNIFVFSNGTTDKFEYTRNSIYIPIENWTVDSNVAYNIAIKNPEIVVFMSKYSPYIDSFSLGGNINHSMPPSWNIAWSDPGVFDNPKWASIEIDANTGEVIYVKTDE